MSSPVRSAVLAVLVLGSSLGRPSVCGQDASDAPPVDASGVETSGVDSEGRPWVRAIRVVKRPRIDGRLDDDAWRRAGRSDHFFQVEPVEGAAPSEGTELLVAFDDDNLYLAVRCRDRHPDEIITTQLERDARLDPDDRVEIVLDTFHDRRFAYFFQVNVGDAKGDGLISPGGFNKAWDGIFEAAGHQNAEGWAAEFAIPFKTVSFRRNGKTWGLNVTRHIRRKTEQIRWSDPRNDTSSFNLATAGDIRGLSGMKPGLGIDVKPFVAMKRADDRVSGRRFTSLQPGLDVFVRISQGTTAAITVNTDFADTEVDERQVNLTRFPLFFPEKRDFFLQDASIFDFSFPAARNRELIPFFSRRIGIGPGGREVPLIAGVKVTGREGPFNFGLLDVQTDEKGVLDKENLLVARATYNLADESSAGFVYTRGDPTSTTRNDVFGVDYTHRISDFLGDKRLDVGGFAFKSWTKGGGDHDLAYGAFIDYPNDLFSLRLEATEIQRDFDPRLGFVRRADVRRYAQRFAWQPRPGNWMRQLRFALNSEVATNTGSSVESAEVFVTPLAVEFESGDEIQFNVVRAFDRLTDTFEISDGVVLAPGRYYWTRATAEIEFSEARPVSGGIGYSFGDFYSGELTTYAAEVVIRPSRYWSFSFEGELNDADLPEGDFITRLYRVRLKLSFSSELTWSNFAQYDNVSDDIGLNSRFRWNFNPGSDIFLVLNQGWNKDGTSIIPSTQELTLKAEYTFRF